MNVVLGVLAAAIILGTFSMVGFYNATVNADHNIASAKAELDSVGAQITDLNNKIVATLGDNGLTGVAAADGLVAESRPQYFPVARAITQITPTDR